MSVEPPAEMSRYNFPSRHARGYHSWAARRRRGPPFGGRVHLSVSQRGLSHAGRTVEIRASTGPLSITARPGQPSAASHRLVGSPRRRFSDLPMLIRAPALTHHRSSCSPGHRMNWNCVTRTSSGADRHLSDQSRSFRPTADCAWARDQEFIPCLPGTQLI